MSFFWQFLFLHQQQPNNGKFDADTNFTFKCHSSVLSGREDSDSEGKVRRMSQSDFN